MAGTEVHLVPLVEWAPLGAYPREEPGGRDTLPFGCGSRLATAAPFSFGGSVDMTCPNPAYRASGGGWEVSPLFLALRCSSPDGYLRGPPFALCLCAPSGP